MKGLDLSKFKKLSTNGKSTIMLHKDGHKVVVAHKPLSSDLKSQLDALPFAQGGEVPSKSKKKPEPPKDHKKELMSEVESPELRKALLEEGVRPMADGGLVTEPEDEESLPVSLNPMQAVPQALINPAAGQQAAAQANMPQPIAPGQVDPGSLPYGVPPEAAMQMTPEQAAQMAGIGMPAAPQGAPQRAPQAEAAPMPAAVPSPETSGQEQMYAKGIQQQQEGILKEADAISKQAQAESLVLADVQARQQAIADDFQSNLKSLNEEREALLHDINNNHVDPNRFLNSQGTGAKISTAIGLILGGIGSGLQGSTENPALKFLNQQIENDIKSQQLEIGKKESLLSANLRQFGNMNQAMEMTRVMQMDIVANQLKQAAAKTQDPIAQARALQAAGKLEAEAAPVLGKMATQRTIATLQGEVRKDPSRAPALIQALQGVDPKAAADLEARHVPGMGIAKTPDDAKVMKEMNGAGNAIKAGVNRLKEISRIPLKSLDPNLRAEAESITTGLKGPMRTALGLGTLSDSDSKLLDNLIRNPTNIFSLDSSNRKALETLAKNTDTGIAKAAEARGLSAPNPMASMTPQQQSYAKWAQGVLQKDPGNQKAKLVLQKLGL
jgi:hypothetical protein